VGYGVVPAGWKVVVGWQEVRKDVGVVVVAEGGAGRRWWLLEVGLMWLPCYVLFWLA